MTAVRSKLSLALFAGLWYCNANFGLGFVVHGLKSFLVLLSSYKGRESLLPYFNCGRVAAGFMCRSRGGDRGSGPPPPLKNYKNLGFLSK